MGSKKVDSKDGSSSERVLIFKIEKEYQIHSNYFSVLKIHTLSWT